MAEFKYNVGDIISHYNVIDRWFEYKSRPNSKYLHVVKYYKLKCIFCGFETTRREDALKEESLNSIKCRGCMRTTKDSKYKIGDVINNSEVISVYKYQRNGVWINRYIMRCLTDGYEYEIEQGNLLQGKGCPICAKNKVVKGFNDIKTVAPWMINLFNNPSDAENCGIGSHKKVVFKCPYCGNITKPISIYNIYNNGKVPCHYCSDGYPITEKFLSNILNTNNINFEYQKSFGWSCNKIYDFYLIDFDVIIETHGRQHYEDFVGSNWGTLESIQRNDEFKYKLAQPHCKKYIVIDCRSSDYTFLLNQYINALHEYIRVDTYKDEYDISFKSRMIDVMEMWNSKNYYTERDIASTLKISENTVRRYLEKLQNMNLLVR